MAKSEDRDSRLQPIYRVHSPPDEEALLGLEKTINAIVEKNNLPPKTWRWNRKEESLADYLYRIPKKPVDIRLSIERQALIVNQRSLFTHRAGEHFALGVNPYGRFSSPMREIVGIFTHKEVLEHLGISQTPGKKSADEALREMVIESANRSKELQSKLNSEIYMNIISSVFQEDLCLDEDSRPLYRGTILGVKATRLYVKLDTPPFEIKIYRDTLEKRWGCPYSYDRKRGIMFPENKGMPEYYIGARITLKTNSFSEGKRWVLVPVID